MNIIEQIQKNFLEFLINHYKLEESAIITAKPLINTDPQRQNFGDLNSNAPMVLAKILKKAPFTIGQAIIEQFKHPAIAQLQLAGAGFINFYLTQETINSLAHEALVDGEQFFAPPLAHPERICLEFVSANPTGPLHFGHGRGGIIGDVLGNVLRFLGHTVHKEFYINDAGNQIKNLGLSLKIRCQQQYGQSVAIPENGYHGEYLVELAKEYCTQYGQRGLEQPDDFFASYAQRALRATIEQTLANYGIHFDTWFSETSLHTSGAIEQALTRLKTKGYLFEEEGAWWLKSTLFGDDKDRVVKKASGELTYVAADIAYMLNKHQRGYNRLIMVLGHDHHSYATRMHSVRQALGIDSELDIILYQLVKIKEGDQQLKLSKRAGRIVSLQDVIDCVGTDVARFFYLNRNADSQLDFDMTLALTKSEENPVFYIQYAYVRTGSILQKAASTMDLANSTPDDAYQMSSYETLLIKKIVFLKYLLASIGATHQTYQLAGYTHELAQLFSTYYGQHKIINPEEIAISKGRLALVKLIRNTLSTACSLLGISLPDKM